MKKCVLLFFTVLLLISNSKAQISSEYGWYFPTNGEYRTLNIFINIIYDVYPERDPCRYEADPVWPRAYSEGINEYIPTYLSDMSFIDSSYTGANNVNGTMTRLYAESSFDSLIILGDCIVANVNLSTMLSGETGTLDSVFNWQDIADTAIVMINRAGGLEQNTLYGYNNIDDFDTLTLNSLLHGKPKPKFGNDKIDYIQILIRNSSKSTDGVHYDYAGAGTLNGQGATGLGVGPRIPIIINGNEYYYDAGSKQGVGSGDISKQLKKVHIHEFSHGLFGGNNFHTSGGMHWLTHNTCTFMGFRGGYGLLGGNSSLVSCNGYERWRLGWTSGVYNPTEIPIAAKSVYSNNVVNSDITQDDGELSFILRDFITTGDVIRIKLPYIDDGASNQYIWLENHQIGNNEKLDFFQFSNTHDCRPSGTAGIYSYYQVGKDILQDDYNDIYPSSETDNLRMICADGNWDMEKINSVNISCVTTGLKTTEIKSEPNPLSGNNDQEFHIFPLGDLIDTIKNVADYPWIMYDGNDAKILPFLGDNFDAFTGNSFMSISTNPTPINTLTYYARQVHGILSPDTTLTNTRKLYLTGLYIEMVQNGEEFLVNIGWDDYDVKNDVRWTGDIVLKEKVNLLSGNTIELDKNYTPNQAYRDPVSNQFAEPTVFTCEDGSEFIQQANSTVVLENLCTMKLKSGSKYVINDGSELILCPGNKLIVESCAELIIKGSAKLIAENPSTVCIEEGAILRFENGVENIQFGSNVIIPQGYIDPRTYFPPHFTITSENETWSNSSYKIAQNIVVKPGAKLIMDGITLRVNPINQIIVEQGGYLEVKNSTLTNDITTCYNESWKGIKVLGTANYDQIPSIGGDQGCVIIDANSIISKAEIGIHSRQGGIVKIRGNSQFKDNVIGVKIEDYANFNNISYIKESEFLVTYSTYTSGVSPTFICLEDVQGVDIRGNLFKNYFPGNTANGRGILSIDAGFSLFTYNSQPNIFEGLSEGIYAYSTGSMFPIIISGNDFSDIDNTIIHISAIDNVQIIENSFEVETKGVSLYNCSGYKVEENTFTGINNSGYGIFVYNSGYANNEIYKNNFINLNKGCYAAGTNSGNMKPTSGLHFICNSYNNNNNPIYVEPNGNIDPYQGSTTVSAGNAFVSSNNYDILNYGGWLYYYANLSVPTNIPSPNYRVTVRGGGANECLSYIGTPKPIDGSLSSLATMTTEVEQLETQRTAIVDGGNTNQLETEIVTSFPTEAYELRNKLLAESPYLSDTILATTAKSENVLPAVMVKQVLKANPHSAVSDKTWNALEERTTPLPDYMLSEIAANEQVLAPMEVLDGNLIKKKNQRERVLNSIINYYQTDTLNSSETALIELLFNDNSLHNRYKLITHYIKKKQSTEAAEIFNSILSDFELTDYELHAHTQYEKVLDIQIELINNQQTYFDLTEVQKTELYEIAEDFGCRAGEYARNILHLIDNAEFAYPEIEIETQQAMPLAPFPNPNETFPVDENESNFKLYPNPSTDYTIFKYNISEYETLNAQFTIRAVTGKIVYTESLASPVDQLMIETGNFEIGAYFCYLTINGRPVFNKILFVE